MPNKKGMNAKSKRKQTYDGENMVVKAPHKEKNQEYAQVKKMLGNGRITAQLFNKQNETRMCIIPGSFRRRRKIWINPDDIILVGIRPYQKNRCDVLYKYSNKEVRRLMKDGELSKDVQIREEGEEEGADGPAFEFVEEIDLEDL